MLLSIALSKNPSQPLIHTSGIFESFGTLKRRIETMTHSGHRSRLRVVLAWSFVAVATAGLVPWKLVSPDVSLQPTVFADDIDYSDTRKQFGNVWVSVSDVRNVTKMKYDIQSDFSRLLANIKPQYSGSSKSTTVTNGNASAFAGGGGGGLGGGAADSQTFSGRPALAIALNIETPGSADVLVLDHLTAVSANGKTHESLPTSSTATMICQSMKRNTPERRLCIFQNQQAVSKSLPG